MTLETVCFKILISDFHKQRIFLKSFKSVLDIVSLNLVDLGLLTVRQESTVLDTDAGCCLAAFILSLLSFVTFLFYLPLSGSTLVTV